MLRTYSIAFLLLQSGADALPSTPIPIGPVHTLILTRHGDSIWNGKHPGCKETFTGWTDVSLSPIGEREAIRTGEMLVDLTRGVKIEALFTSTLTRAKMTAHYCWWAYYDRVNAQYYYNELDRQNKTTNEYSCHPPHQFLIDYRLNERHYGSLQGLVKADAEAGLHGHSYEDVYKWRRSWHAVPPQLQCDDPRHIEELRKFGHFCEVPKSESLSMVAENRIRPFIEESLTPLLDEANDANDGKEGGAALIVAHANSIRALIGVICNVEKDPGGSAISKLESMKIPTANPLVLRYRKTTEDGIYHPVDSSIDNHTRNDLPVFPLNSFQLKRKTFE